MPADPAGPKRFPRSLVIARRRRHPALPLRPRRGYPAARHHGLPSAAVRPPGVTRHRPGRRQRPAGPATGTRRLRPISARFGAGTTLRSVTRRFLTYAFPPRSPGPHHLAVLTRPGFVRAACHPTRHLPDPAALSFTAPLRWARRRGSLTSTRSTSASRRTTTKT